MLVLNKPQYSSYYYVNGQISQTIVKLIDLATSDHPTGYDRTDKFIKGEWDGKIHLFQKSSSGYFYFPCGIIKDVTEILDLEGVEYVIKKEEYDYEPLDATWNDKINLYPYQVDCLLSLVKPGSGVLSLPCGSGKTIIALNYAYARNSPFLVLVHRKELLYQWEEEIKRILNIEPTIVDEGEGYPTGKCCVSMIQTLWSGVKKGKIKKISGFPLLIVDEAHVIPSNTAYNVAMRCDSYWRVGLSATPYREDNTQLKIFGATGRIVTELSVPDLIDQKYLATPKFIIIRPTSGSFKSMDSFSEVYRKGIVINEDRNRAIVECSKKISEKNGSLYVHVSQISHGKNLSKNIDGSRFVSSKTPSRTQDIKDFSEGKYPVLVSTLLKEGVDVPAIDSIIFATGKKSSITVIQTIGRALRTAKGKKNALIIDFFDHGHRYLETHAQSRMNTYAETYGKYFKPKYVRSGDL